MEKVQSKNSRPYIKLRLFNGILIDILFIFSCLDKIKENQSIFMLGLTLVITSIMLVISVKDLFNFYKDNKKGVAKIEKAQVWDYITTFLAIVCLILYILEILKFI